MAAAGAAAGAHGAGVLMAGFLAMGGERAGFVVGIVRGHGEAGVGAVLVFHLAALALVGFLGADGGDAFGDGDFEFFFGLGFVVEVGEGDAGEAFADGAFDGAEFAFFFDGDEGEGVAGFGSAAGAADAVNVIFGDVGDVEVDDVGDGIDVDAAGGDVGGDEDAVLAGFEAGEGGVALGHGAVGVDGGGVDLVAAELIGEAVGAVLGAAEDDDGVEVLVFQKLEEEEGFELLRDGVDGLGDAHGGLGLAVDLDGDGVFEEFAGEGADFVGHCGRKEKGLFLAGEEFGGFF